MTNSLTVSYKDLSVSGAQEVLEQIESVCEKLGIAHYLTGAVARNAIFAAYKKPVGDTRDMDWAMQIESYHEFEELKRHLTNQFGYSQSKENIYQITSPRGVELDILPFGGLTIYDERPDGESQVAESKPDGFKEVYDHGTTKLNIDGKVYLCCTLPGVVLLKLIAFDDRPDKRIKDIQDIRSILDYWPDIIESEVWDHHADLYVKDISHRDVCFIVMGREIRKITSINRYLHERISEILQRAITENSDMLMHMLKHRENESLHDMKEILQLIVKGMGE